MSGDRILLLKKPRSYRWLPLVYLALFGGVSALCLWMEMTWGHRGIAAQPICCCIKANGAAGSGAELTLLTNGKEYFLRTGDYKGVRCRR